MCALKQEKELIRQQYESHQHELTVSREYARQQSAKIQSLEKEKIELSNRMEQDTLCSKLEATDNVIQLMKDKGDLEIQCRQLKANLAGMDRSEMSVSTSQWPACNFRWYGGPGHISFWRRNMYVFCSKYLHHLALSPTF